MKIYLCPSDRKYHCSWEGHAEDILDHFEKEHDELLHYNESFLIDLETHSENRLFLLNGEIYLVQVTTEGNTLILKLRYLGPQKLANKINYFVTLKTSNKFCESSLIRTTPEGFFEVDLEELNSNETELKSVICSLNISKEFMDDDSLENVFLEKSTENRKNDDESISQLPDIVVQGAIDAFDTGNKNIEERKAEGNKEENNSCEKEIETEAVNVEKDIKEDQDTSSEHSNPRRDKCDNNILCRSKSTAFEDMRRSWYRTKSTLSLSSIQEMDAPLLCTNCNNFLKVPIYICPNGHHFCEKCQLGECVICEKKVTYVRDSDFENIVNKYSLSPCRFQKFGCPEKLLHNDLHQHETNCTFCLYKCPLEGCVYESQFKGMCKHLRIIHASTKLLTSFILSFQNYPEAFLANEEKGIFYCYVTYGQEEIEWHATFFGPKERNFFCELKFKDGKMKEPVLLKKIDNSYSVKKSVNDLKRMKIKPKNAVLTITF